MHSFGGKGCLQMCSRVSNSLFYTGKQDLNAPTSPCALAQISHCVECLVQKTIVPATSDSQNTFSNTYDVNASGSGYDSIARWRTPEADVTWLGSLGGIFRTRSTYTYLSYICSFHKIRNRVQSVIVRSSYVEKTWMLSIIASECRFEPVSLSSPD